MSLTPDVSPWTKLLHASLDDVLPGESVTSAFGLPLSDEELMGILEEAVGLALSDKPQERELAYEIATRVVHVWGAILPPGALVAVRTVLARLSNFPGLDLLSQRVAAGEPMRAAATTILGDLAQQAGSTTFVLGNDRPRALTSFQWRVFQALEGHMFTAFSGPTSSGKSFVLSLDLVRRLKKQKQTAVYVVPTRALIRQVAADLRRDLRDAGLGQVPVRTTPIPMEPSQTQAGAVFVLTQERLLALLYASQPAQEVDFVFVDEAHSIQESHRGILLQSAMEHIRRRWPKASIHFSAPMVGNPAILLRPIGIAEGPAIVETQSPVSQDVILAHSVKNRRELLHFQWFRPGQLPIDLGNRKPATKRPSKAADGLAWLASSITKQDQSTIVYANGPGSAETLADRLAGYWDPWPSGEIPKDVLDAVAFLRDYVHPKYRVAGILEKGVAVHHGKMPLMVRGVIEDLYVAGHIRMMVCTSTLLAGVNLPVRNIVIGKRPGRGRTPKNQHIPLDRHGYLNLVGRAGRMGKEFHGTVWIYDSDPQTWNEYDSTELP